MAYYLLALYAQFAKLSQGPAIISRWQEIHQYAPRAAAAFNLWAATSPAITVQTEGRSSSIYSLNNA